MKALSKLMFFVVCISTCFKVTIVIMSVDIFLLPAALSEAEALE
jgi:hypothetical protein